MIYRQLACDIVQELIDAGHFIHWELTSAKWDDLTTQDHIIDLVEDVLERELRYND
jgi:hypothetical protein